MIKIPVLDTIAAAYRFTVEQLGAIIGLIWIPQLIVSIGSYLTSMPYHQRLVAGAKINEVGPARMLAMLGEVIALVMFTVIAVAVVRQALGLRKGPAMAYFAFGKAELRVLGAVLALAGVGTVFILALVFGVLALRGVGGDAVAGAAMVMGGAALIFAMVRLSFLVVPASVSNSDYGIEKSWTLTRGNFWRILAVMIACMGPVTLVTLVAMALVLGPDLLAADPALLKDQAALTQFETKQAIALAQNQPLLLGLGFALAPFTFGLWLGAAANVYKVLSENRGITA